MYSGEMLIKFSKALAVWGGRYVLAFMLDMFSKSKEVHSWGTWTTFLILAFTNDKCNFLINTYWTFLLQILLHNLSVHSLLCLRDTFYFLIQHIYNISLQHYCMHAAMRRCT